MVWNLTRKGTPLSGCPLLVPRAVVEEDIHWNIRLRRFLRKKRLWTAQSFWDRPCAVASCDHTSESLWLYGVIWRGRTLCADLHQRSMIRLQDAQSIMKWSAKDSAVEVFLAFAEKGKELTNNDMYLNFEVNANGAMYAKYGFGRQGKTVPFRWSL